MALNFVRAKTEKLQRERLRQQVHAGAGVAEILLPALHESRTPTASTNKGGEGVSRSLHIVYSKGRSEHHASDTPRQTMWSQKMREAGLYFCGEPTNGKSLCPKHLKAQAARMRERAA